MKKLHRYNEIILNFNEHRQVEIMESAFWHEFLHMALGKMKDNKCDDESFINILGGLIHQALETMEY